MGQWRLLLEQVAAPASILAPVKFGGRKRPDPQSAEPELVVGLNARDLQFRPSITGWTPHLVGSVALQADGGNLVGLADLVDAMFADDRIEGVLQTLTLSTFGLPLQFEGGDPDLTELLRGEGKSCINGELNRMHPEPELTQIYNWGVMAGVGLFQRKRLPRVYGEMQKFRLVHWHPRFLSYDHEGTSGSHWRVQTRSGMKPVIAGGQFGLFLPYGEKRPWNQGKWRKVAFPWLVKHFSVEDRANQGEVVGSPTWVGGSAQGGTEKQRRKFLAELVKLGRNGRIVLPPGWTLDLKEAMGRTWEIFSESIKWSDQAITVAMVSQVTTTEGSPGFDSGKPQDALLASVTRYYAKAFASCLYELSLKPWAYENTGSRDNAPCAYWNTERSNSQASAATTFETVGRAGPELDAWLDRSGLMVDAKAVTAAFGVPVKSNVGAPPPVATTTAKTPPTTEPKSPIGGMADPVLP